MAKLDKTQRAYALGRLSTESSKAIAEFMKNKPTEYSKDEVRDKLESKGFILEERNYFYVNIPPSAKMVQNKEAIEAFITKVNEAEQQAKDRIYLGDTDGTLEILEQFTAALNKL